jgi:L,D-transpeptidase catalytic domain/Family of unknown function (DUF5719)
MNVAGRPAVMNHFRFKRIETIRKCFLTGLVIALALTVSLPGIAHTESGSGPPPPGGLEVVPRQEDLGLRVTLSWTHRPDCAGYKVYRAPAADGPYEFIGGISASSMEEYPFFLDDGARGPETYYYRVSAVDATCVEGPACAPVQAKPQRYRRASAVEKRILVSLADQRVYFFESGVIVNVFRCSTGAGGTPTGNYSILAHRGTVSGCNYWMDWRPNYGMHAWPSYLGAYEENLGVAPRSHGCIRLHPLEAYWPYQWAPDGTPLTVISGPYGGLPLKGMSCSNGAAAPSRNWYFPEGFVDAEFSEYLVLFNPGSEPVDALTSYYPEGHPAVVENYHLEPGSRATISVNGVTGIPYSFGHAVHIKADGPIVAQQAEYFNMQGRRDGTVYLGATKPEHTWYFAEGYTGARFSTYLVLFNPSDKETACHVSYMVAGMNTFVHEFTMPPKSRGTTLVNALPGLMDKEVAIRVDSSEPVVAGRAEYSDWTGNPNYVNGGDTVLGQKNPAKTWYLAEGSTGYYFDQYILILNPTGELATVNVQLITTGGQVGYQCQVAPFSRGTIAVDSIAGVQDAETAAIINSDKDIVVERTMYCNRDSKRGDSMTGGINRLSKDWFFAEGYTGGTFDEYLSVLNPGSETAYVTFLFHRESGEDVGASFAIGANCRFKLHADEVPGVEWAASSVEIHSNVPIAAEQTEFFCIPR